MRRLGHCEFVLKYTMKLHRKGLNILFDSGSFSRRNGNSISAIALREHCLQPRTTDDLFQSK